MYPHGTQFETRRQEPERQLHSLRDSGGRARVRNLARPPVGPPRYKLALLTWAGTYGLITLLLALLGPVIASWPLALRSLVLSMTMVVALTWLVMPRLTQLFGAWLNPSA